MLCAHVLRGLRQRRHGSVEIALSSSFSWKIFGQSVTKNIHDSYLRINTYDLTEKFQYKMDGEEPPLKPNGKGKGKKRTREWIGTATGNRFEMKIRLQPAGNWVVYEVNGASHPAQPQFSTNDNAVRFIACKEIAAKNSLENADMKEKLRKQYEENRELRESLKEMATASMKLGQKNMDKINKINH